MSSPQQSRDIVKGEGGYVLITALMLMVILTIIGLTLNEITVNELNIAGNNRLQRQTFSMADGGTEAGIILLEENFSCPNGFDGPPPIRIGQAEVTGDLLGAKAEYLNFHINEKEPEEPYPTDAKRHVRIPNDDSAPHTNLHFLLKKTEFSEGDANTMVSGYEGLGYSPAHASISLVTIDSQRIDVRSSQSRVWINWRHRNGQEGMCRY